MKLLILGGTSDASALGRALVGDARFDAMLSLAGRTRRPAPQPLPTRSGGFGGVEGLVRYLAENRVDVLIDATHPFAVQISHNAVAAARQTGVPLLAVWRPAWREQPGDRWINVPDLQTAALALGREPRRVLLTIGQKDLAPFTAASWHHYVLRSVEPPDNDHLPPDVEVISARGPFAIADERTLLREKQIDILVSKNSGGSATEAKLDAARQLRLAVVMVARPAVPDAATVATVPDVLHWLAQRHAGHLRGA